jgi:hypothetical protein
MGKSFNNYFCFSMKVINMHNKAEQIGLPTPASNFAEKYDFPTEQDHVLQQ